MAVKWNKIYRGGVHKTTAETHQVNYTGAATVLLPGGACVLDADDGISPVVAEGAFFYVIGEQLHGSVDDNQVQPEGQQSTLRLYIPHSGDLLAGRAAAGVVMNDSDPLTINAQGQFDLAVLGTDPVFAYIDNPSSAHPGTEPATTVADQLIPIKIK